MRPEQNPVVPLLVGGLVAVAVVAVLSVVVFVWAIRRPAGSVVSVSAPGAPENEVIPAVTVEAIVACDLPNLSSGTFSGNWVDIIQSKVPQDTRLVRSGWEGMTLAEANRVEIPAAAEGNPDAILLWTVLNDVRKGVSL